MGNIARNFTPRPTFFAHFDANSAFDKKNFASCREDRLGSSKKHSRRVGLPCRAAVGRCEWSAMTKNLAVKPTPPAHTAVFLKGHHPRLEVGSIGKIIPRRKNGLHIASEKKGIGPFVHRNSECGSHIVARGISRISTGSVAGGFRFGKEGIVRHGTFSHVAVSIGHEAFKVLFRLRAQVASACFESQNFGLGPVGLLVFTGIFPFRNGAKPASVGPEPCHNSPVPVFAVQKNNPAIPTHIPYGSQWQLLAVFCLGIVSPCGDGTRLGIEARFQLQKPIGFGRGLSGQIDSARSAARNGIGFDGMDWSSLSGWRDKNRPDSRKIRLDMKKNTTARRR